MYQNSESKYFPHLVVQRSTGKNSGGDMLYLFELDWSSFDQKILASYTHKGYDVAEIAEIEGFLCLPKPWEQELQNVKFLLTHDYMQQIQWDVHRAQDVYTHYVPLDTMIREICVEPGKAHISVAFNCLVDCWYDAGKSSPWKRRTEDGVSRHLLHSMLLTRFWMHQTGRGLVMGNSHLEKYKGRIEKYIDSQEDHEEFEAFKRFESSMATWMERWEQHMQCSSKVKPPIAG